MVIAGVSLVTEGIRKDSYDGSTHKAGPYDLKNVPVLWANL